MMVGGIIQCTLLQAAFSIRDNELEENLQNGRPESEQSKALCHR